LFIAGSLGIATSVSVFGLTAFATPGNGHDHPSQTALDHRSEGTAGTSGSPTSPQPFSTADQTGNGANGSGPYNSTRNGSPSGNGNGNGQGVGKPCAGCVGKADNKNPLGQLPNGSDHNNGYECDGNHGIGRTNPAHTGCRTTTPPTPPPTTPPTTPPPGCVSECAPGHQGVPTALITPSPEIVAAGLPSNQVVSATRAAGALAFTGADIAATVLAAVGAVILGIAAVWLTRRRRSATPTSV
jgi:LPXTG-motif cell wall-anchored protein